MTLIYLAGIFLAIAFCVGIGFRVGYDTGYDDATK